MKRVELLIDEVRNITGNQNYDANSGLSQSVLVRYLKNAQVELYKHVSNAKNSAFLVDSENFQITNDQQTYPYPRDIYLQNIETLQWALNPGSSGYDWVNLGKGITKDRLTSQNGYAFEYILRKDHIILSPPLQSGYLRFTYMRRFPDLEKRSGQVSAVTINGDNEVTALTLNAAEGSFDPTYLNQLQALCVVDRYGYNKAMNIEFTSVDAGTGVVTLGTPFALYSGETIAVGDYVTAGFWTMNTSLFEDVAESYIIKYAVYETRYGDYSKWTTEAKDDLLRCADSVVDAYADVDDDITQVAIINSDFLDLSR